jgi:hypothetical protein
LLLCIRRSSAQIGKKLDKIEPVIANAAA